MWLPHSIGCLSAKSQFGRLLEIDFPLLFELLVSLVVRKMWWFGNGNVKGRGLICLIMRSILAPAVYGCLCDIEGRNLRIFQGQASVVDQVSTQSVNAIRDSQSFRRGVLSKELLIRC